MSCDIGHLELSERGWGWGFMMQTTPTLSLARIAEWCWRESKESSMCTRRTCRAYSAHYDWQQWKVHRSPLVCPPRRDLLRPHLIPSVLSDAARMPRLWRSEICRHMRRLTVKGPFPSIVFSLFSNLLRLFCTFRRWWNWPHIFGLACCGEVFLDTFAG